MKKLWILLTLGVAFCAACSEDNATDPSPVASEIGISGFDPAEVIALEGGSVEVTVKSNEKWRLTGKKTWCTPSVVEGKSGDKVTFTAEANPTGDSRSIVYKFFCGNKTVPFTVTQAPAKIFSIESEPEVEVAAVGGNVIVKVSTNIAYTFKVEDDGAGWITAPETRGVTTDRVTFRVQANGNFSPRTGHITFTANGTDYSVVVNQAQTNKLSVDKTAHDVVADGGTVLVKVTANVEYTVGIETAAAGWIHRVEPPVASAPTGGLTEYTETFTIDAAKAPRAGKITFRSADGLLSQTVIISQEGPSVEYVTIPDANFATVLKNLGWVIAAPDAPGKFLVTETGLAAKKLTLAAHLITTIKGVEAFPSLTQLEGNNCRVTHYDLSTSKIWEIYIARLGTAPADVIVSSENLTDLTLSGNTTLITLDLSGCSKLSMVKVNGCTKLKTIYLKTGQVVNSITKPDGCTIEYK